MEFLDTIGIKILGVLEFESESPIHVGAGGEEAVRELIRLPSGEIVIPSSTWKGAFRSLSEQIARQASFKGLSCLATKLYVEKARVSYRGKSEDLNEEFERFTTDFLKAFKGETVERIPHKADELESLMKRLGYDKDEIQQAKAGEEKALLEEMAEKYIALHCPIGRLYGNMVTAGKVRFTDTYVYTASDRRPGVGIDRKSGKVREGSLYFIEVVPKGTFKLRITADNLLPNEDDSKVFATTLETIETLGISLGARKSAGLGNLKLSQGSFYVIDLKDDHKSGMFMIGNPFKKGKRMDVRKFIEWLRT